MRVFVLGLDGTDYYLVQKWNLKWILQRTNGTFNIGKEYFGNKDEPYSPVIWTSIITGKKPSEHKIKDWWIYNRFLNRLRFLPIIRHIKGKRKILWRLGIKPHVPNRRDLKCDTIFDIVKPSVAVYVPGYNDTTEFRMKLSNSWLKGINDYINAIWEIHEERKRATFRALEENDDWKLFMTYFDLADLMGHILITQQLKMMKVYFELNRLTGKLYKYVTSLFDDVVFLIISDHGMTVSEDGVSGRHTCYAFWSLNIDENWKPKDFTHFFYKIQEWVK